MTLVLTRSDVESLLDIDACIDAVSDAFVEEASGRALASGVLGTHVEAGGFHIKTSGLARGRGYFVAKVNANFPGNRSLHGLPTIQGVLALFDATNGTLLALMDSGEITTLRTAAATAVAARHLARSDSSAVTIIGCGIQGRSQLLALSRVRSIVRARAFDADSSRAREYADEMSDRLGFTVEAVDDYRGAARESDIVVTCTPSRSAILGRPDVGDGAFIAAVGADSDVKQEIEPSLLAASKVVVDVLEQCEGIGDLHHAIEAGVMHRDEVHATLGDVVSGRKPGRESDDEVIVFDSTGTAIEDVAAASVVFERAVERGIGRNISLNT